VAGDRLGTDPGDDESMLRKLLSSAVSIAVALVAVPTMLGALRSQSAFAAPFTHGDVSTRGWSSRQSVDAQRLRVGVPVQQTLTVDNAGSLPAEYRLSAKIDGDRAFARHLLVVVTRSDDNATIFAGEVTTLRSVALGRFNEHTRETFRLQVTLRGSGGNDNALQGRRAAVAFNWTATQTN
jgi:hypothetical protein